MRVTLLYFDDCPHWRVLDERLRAALAQLGLPYDVTYQPVHTPADAERLGMSGSPTLLLDGTDPFGDSRAAPGLACRLYDTPRGRAGAPTIEQLINALGPQKP